MFPCSDLPNLAPSARVTKGLGEPEGCGAAESSDEVGAGDDVAPLVTAAHLQAAAVAVEEFEEVVGLEQGVGKLGVGDALLAGLEAVLDRISRHHRVDREKFADIAEKVDQLELARASRRC